MFNIFYFLFGSCLPILPEISDENDLQYVITKYENATAKKYQYFYDILLIIDQMGYYPEILSYPPSEMMKKLKNYRNVILTEKGIDIAKFHKYFGECPKSVKMEMIIYTGCFNDMTLGTVDENMQNFIHHAVKARELNILRCLLATGENVNLQDKFGKTPLFYTCSKKHQDGETTKILFMYGANPNIEDSTGKNYIQYAEGKRNFNNLESMIMYNEK